MELPVETGEVGRVLDFRVASWDKERFGECQTVELPFGTGGGGVPYYWVASWDRGRLGECQTVEDKGEVRRVLDC